MNFQQIIENSYRIPPYKRDFGFEARLDGISFSFHKADLLKTQEFLEQLLPAPFRFRDEDRGTRWYKNLRTGTANSVLAWQHRQGYELGLCELGGEFFSFLSPQAQKNLVDFVARLSKCTVLVLNIDDFSRRYSPSFFVEEWENRRCKGFKTWNQIKSFSPETKRLGYGDSASFGRRGNLGGGKRFVCYDKNVESRGCLDCYRYELSLYKIKAQSACKQLASTDLQHWHELIISIMQGELRFERFKLSEFQIKLGSKRPKNCLYNKHRWLNQQVATTFAAVQQVYGEMGHDFGKILEQLGKEKDPKKYQQLVDGFRNIYHV